MVFLKYVVMDQNGQKCWVLMTQKIERFGHNPFVSFELTMSSLLYFHDAPDGRKIISKQIDYHSFESILYRSPALGWAFEHVFRRLTTWEILYPTRLIATAWPAIADALKSVPGIDANWDEITKAASRFWWLPRPKFQGRQLAPYDPAL